MALWRRGADMWAEADLYGPRRAAVRIGHAGSAPDVGRADRVRLGVAAAALGAAAAPSERWEAHRDALTTLARRIASSGSGPLPGDLIPLEGFGTTGLVAVVPWEGEGRARVRVELRRAPGGTAPRLAVRPDDPGPAAEVATLAIVVALAADAPDDRMALALGLEGVLAWFRDADRMSPPRDALAFAIAHAAGRLGHAGREAPPGL